MTTHPQAAATVTQSDREAAAAIADLCHLGFSAHYIRQGKHDDKPDGAYPPSAELYRYRDPRFVVTALAMETTNG